MPLFDRAAVSKGALEIAKIDWLGGYRQPPRPEWARICVMPHIGTDAPEAIEHAMQVYTDAFKAWLLHPHEAPKPATPRVRRVYARWCD